MRTWIASLGACVTLGLSAFIFVGSARTIHAQEPGTVAQAEGSTKGAEKECC